MNELLSQKRTFLELRTFEDILYEELLNGLFTKYSRKSCHGGLGCSNNPVYGYEKHNPTHCEEHRPELMNNMLDTQCQHSQCNTEACFGLVGEKAMFCKTHKTSGMINVVSVSKRCEFQNCLTIPRFGCKRGVSTHCTAHKLPGMWNTTIKTCQESKCKNVASFGYTSTKPLRCAAHKSRDMVNKKSALRSPKLPVTHPLCMFCDVRAFYGDCEIRRRFCKEHMDPEKHWKLSFCKQLGCNEVATFSCTNIDQVFCETHASTDHIRFAPPVPFTPTAAVYYPLEMKAEEFEMGVIESPNPLEQELNFALDHSIIYIE